MKITRRSALGAFGLAIVQSPMILGTGAHAQARKFSFKMGNNWPTTHSVNVRLAEAFDKIRQQSDGRLDIKLFPGGQLGGDLDLISQTRSGALEFTLITNVILGTLVPAVSLPNMGFAFPDYATVWRAIDGDLGKYLRESVEKFNLVTFDKLWDNGYRQTTSRQQPIKSLDDLRGFKIRVPPSPVLTSLFQALGASPAGLSFNEVYSALQTGVFDGQENPLAIVESAKLFEVQRCCAVTNHMWDGGFTLANPRSWNGLPDDLKEIFSTNVAAATIAQREDNRKLNDGLRAKLEASGMTFTSPDLAPFRARLKESGFYSQWREKFGDHAWHLLEQSAGSLT